MKEVLVSGGRIVGNINVERLVLRDKGQIFGNVTAKSIRIDPECVILGTLNVNPHAPSRINLKGEPVIDDSKVQAAVPTPPAQPVPTTPT
jgi:cytoskeletal protein CcmA (bactofilin family)